MSDTVSILKGTTNSYQTTAEHFNAIATDIINDGIVGSFTNTSGVAPATGGLACNAQGSPNMTVAVTAGICYVTATPAGQSSQRLRANIAAQNATITSNSTGSTRYDWIYVKIDPTTANAPNVSGSDVASIVASRSTSSSTDNGTPPTYGYNLSVVTVANGASSITNGNITDKRGSVNVVNTTSTFSNPYKFSVYRSSAQTITSTSTEKVAFNAELFDTGGNFDSTTNNRFVAPISGFYYFSAAVLLGTSGTNDNAVYLYKNGSSFKAGTAMLTGAGNQVYVVSGFLQLAATDYVEIYIQNASGVGCGLGTGSASTYFDGFLVSAT